MRAIGAALLILITATGAWAQNIRTLTAARDGWAAIRDGRNEAAAHAFEEALLELPREPSLHFGLGLASHRLGQSARAHGIDRNAPARAGTHGRLAPAR